MQAYIECLIINHKINSMGIPEILIIAVAILVLFGAKRIPALMKGLGKGINDFNEEKNKSLSKEKEKDTDLWFGSRNQTLSPSNVDFALNLQRMFLCGDDLGQQL